MTNVINDLTPYRSPYTGSVFLQQVFKDIVTQEQNAILM